MSRLGPTRRECPDPPCCFGSGPAAERARRELRATGETIRKRAAPAARAAGASEALTAQEAQVAWLARDRLSNPEIGARLFISPRTSAAGQPASPAPRRHRPPG
jgi:hypothetical protein